MVFMPESGITNTLFQYDLETVARANMAVINVVVPTEVCYSVLIEATCSSYLRPCVTYQNVTYPLPMHPCRPVCDRVLQRCGADWAGLSLPAGVGTYMPRNRTFPLICNVTDSEAQGNELYPVDHVTYTIDQTVFDNTTNTTNTTTTTLDVPCLSFPQSALPRECQSPLIKNSLGQCGFGCPLPALSDSQYDNTKIMQGVVGWISWVTSSLLLISFLVIPALRKFPKNLILMVTIAANIAAGGIILPSMAGYHNIWCGESDAVIPEVVITVEPYINTQVVFQEEKLLFGSPACTFQGAVIMFGFLSAVFWWAIVAFNMCLELFFRKFADQLESGYWKWGRICIYHVLGWGIPFLFMVITAAADRIKFASGATYCFVSPEEDKRYELAFWFIPVGLSLLLGFILFVLAIIRLIIGSFQVSKAKLFIFIYYRLLLFVFLYLFLFTFIFSYNLQVAANASDIQAGFNWYYLCLISPVLLLEPTIPECVIPDSVSNYNLIMLKAFAISALGFFVFVTFLSWEILYFWYDVAKHIVLMLVKRDLHYGRSLVRKIITNTRDSLSDSNTVSVTMTRMDEVLSPQSGEGPHDDQSTSSSSSVEESTSEEL